jgi:hypothetical protein
MAEAARGSDDEYCSVYPAEGHHYISHSVDAGPLRWIERCQFCGHFSGKALRAQLQPVLIVVPPDGVKMLRETLCVAQSRILNSPVDAGDRLGHSRRLGWLINECDRHRPLGPDGKHGDRHTETCGCEDK